MKALRTWEIGCFVLCWQALDLTVAVLVSLAYLVLFPGAPLAGFICWCVWISSPTKALERRYWLALKEARHSYT